MLKQRVLTALALLAVLLPALFYPRPEPFEGVMLLLVAAGAWEWGRLNGPSASSSAWAWGGAIGCAAVCGVIWACGGLDLPVAALRGWWSGLGVFWVWVAVGLLAQGVEGWKKISLGLRFGLGWLALVGAWWAVAQARGLGVGFLLSVLTLVWMADIGAYFVGRACGGSLIQRKLAARISPGKSWEGALGGLLGVVLLAWAWVNLDTRPGASSLYALLAQAGWPFALLAVLFLGVMSVAGDLVESLIKRAVGVKDSSGLLPGHGGVLDRIDALLPVLPLAMMLASWLMPVTA